MKEIKVSYALAVAEQMSFVSAFLGGVSVTILITIVVFTASKRSISLIVGLSALAACSLLVSVIASLRLIIALHPDLPIAAEPGKISVLWHSMIFGYGLGVLSLIICIGLAGWLRSRRTGIITTLISGIAMMFFALTSIFSG